jgi:hypothetical protein
MVAKNERPLAVPDIRGHVHATRLAYEWVTKFIALLETGRATQAKAAEHRRKLQSRRHGTGSRKR